MNWIILIIAGLFEVGFTFCLGKMKGATGTDFYLWGTGFVISVTLSMYLLAKAAQIIAYRHCISCLDGDRSSGDCIDRYPVLSWTGNFGTFVLYDNFDYFNRRIETDMNLIIGSFNW